MNELSQIMLFAQSMALGALIGLERQRHPGNKAGLRTFTLIAVAGTLFAYLGQQVGASWMLAVVAALIGGMMINAYARDGDAGTTSVMAALVTFGLGALVAYGYSMLAVALAIVTMALLYFRTELHGVANQLTQRDYVSFLQFAVLAFVLLPLLPDRTYDPFDAVNPYRVGWLVVLISGVSLAGYVALRIFGERRGALLAGVFGGLASTTATTLVFARRVKHDSAQLRSSASIILLANLILYLRIGLFVVLIAPALLSQIAPMFAGGLVAGGAFTFWFARRLPQQTSAAPLHIPNPLELRTALGFALLLAVILIGVAWLNRVAGVTGVYVGAFIAGLTDIDAIVLSTLRMTNSAHILPLEGAITVAIAFFANFCFKLGLATVSGSPRLAWPVGAGFACMMVGMAIGLALVAARAASLD